jgi:hypothetical protein
VAGHCRLTGPGALNHSTDGGCFIIYVPLPNTFLNQELSPLQRAKGTSMRKAVVLLYLSLGLLTAACADQSPLGPSQLDDNTISAAGGTKSGKGGVGGSAGGIKGNSK